MINNKLDRGNVENIIHLTNLQQGMLFHYINDETSNMYHEQLSLTIKGDLKLELLVKAWQYVVKSNEMLRTVFRWNNIDRPVQIVLKQHEIPIEYFDFSNENDKDIILEKIKLKDLNHRIDITNETLRIYICKLDKETHEMIIANHHILYDGWSNGIILKEVMGAYNILYANNELKDVNKTKFSQFIKYLNSKDKEEEKKYWTNYLKSLDYNDNCFSIRKIGDYKEISYNISTIKLNKIKEFSKENKLLLSSILYGTFGLLIQKLNNSKEALFGTTVSGRPESISAVDKMVGLFINTVPLRILSNEKTTLLELMKSIDTNLKERKNFENTSLINIKDYCGLKSEEELFNSIVTIENYPLDFNMNEENVLKIDKFSIKERTNYNMALEILTFNELEFKFTFNISAIDETLVKKFGPYLERILDKLLSNPDICIKDICLLTEEEKNKIIYKFNNNKMDYAKDKTICELFEEQVRKTPENIAVVFEDKKLTYKELNEKSNKLARILRKNGVKPDSIVALMVDRSIEMLVGIMGIIKSGGAYLPIDPNWPQDRISYVLKNSSCEILVTSEDLEEQLNLEINVINILGDEVLKEDINNLDLVNKAEDLIYVLYTSGTTGNPKGVMVEHKNVTNLITSLNNEIYNKYNKFLKLALVSPYYFDASIQQLFGSILNGHTLYIVNDDIRRDGKGLLEYLEKNNIEITDGTPSHLKMLSSILSKDNKLSVEHYIIGGEELQIKVVKEFYKYTKKGSGPLISNVYGPTECTVDSSIFTISPTIVNELESIPIGKPMGNYKLFIMDDNYNHVPIGVPGELYISGHGVSRGYINKPELTKEKFLNNPLAEDTKLYKTGDLVKWLPDGNVEYLGRIDNQVKIRGFRIELGEIENKLIEHRNIKEAAVVVKENKESEKYICAYVIADKNLNELNLKAYLKKALPAYMVPSYFVELDNMPLTSNGKLDKKSLPDPDFNKTEGIYEAPRNKLEETLVEIWSEVLGQKHIGISDNFFDLGGHSLKATILMSKIHKKINKEVPLKVLFKFPTIKELSVYIESEDENKYSNIEKVEEKEYYQTSSAQKRMYMLQKFDKESTAYNMPVVFKLEGEVNEKKIEEVFSKLIRRHESLRTYFETLDGEIIQRISDDYEFKLVTRKEENYIEEVVNKFIKPFDLDKGHLFRAEIIANEGNKYLLIDMHHIISDGVSTSILVKEFTELYNGEILEDLKLQYKDFAAWQNEFLKSEEMKKQEKFWLDNFSDEIPVLNLPTDFERPLIQSFEGDNIKFKLNKEITLKLRKLTRETNTTMHMVLLSVFAILLSKYSNQEDIVIGTPVAGRPYADFQNIMGMFVNTLALRNKPEGNKEYSTFLKEVKENSLSAYENQSYQLEALIEKLNLERDTSRNPLFDVMFNMMDTGSYEKFRLNDITLETCSNERKIAKFDLTLNAIEKDEVIELSIEYCTKLFKKDTVERLLNHYVLILYSISKDTNMKLCEIEMLSNEEKKQLLYRFNDTKADYPSDRTIYELFEEQVERTPDNIALICDNKKVTYKELNERSNTLARALIDKGIKQDNIVTIMMDRTEKLIVSILAVLKSGGAYLPIDPDYPKDRVNYILDNSKSNIILTQAKYKDKVDEDIEVIDIDNIELYQYDNSNLSKKSSSENLAYVIYTSGTTGKPKGVAVQHKSLMNYIYYAKNRYFKEERLIMPLYTSISFDLTITSIFTPLISNGIIEIHKEKELDKLIDKVFTGTGKKIIKVTPAHLSLLKEINNLNKSIIMFIVGGEDLTESLAKSISNLFDNKVEIINEYGPTEATVGCVVHRYNYNNIYNNSVLIGKPINNTKVYILNNHRKLVPIGVTGELYLSGDSLAKGYFNNNDLTSEKFTRNPYEQEERIYRTGDIARWLPSGEIECLGRIDNQIKIRGFRIELGEIENRILEHKDVKEAAVIIKENIKREKYICAYIVCNKDFKEIDLKTYLKETLPGYMIPSYFIELNKMPITPNGKLDKKSLPEPDLNIATVDYEAPRNEIEETLVTIWEEVLGHEHIGINDNFFELGGHSLKATILMARIHKNLNKEVELKELFKFPTIKEFSKYIKNIDENPYSKIKKVEVEEYYETSSAQKRMYMLQKLNRDSIAYNMPVAFEMEGKINKVKIEETLFKLIKGHDALRTYFETLNGKIVQKLQKDYKFKLITKKEEENIEQAITKFIKPFDLEKGPLFRAEIIENKEKTYLLIDMHHIISDGVSTNILIDEFSKLYDGSVLEDLKLQYKDFAAWQNEFLESEKMKEQEQFWLDNFKDEIPVLDFPIDFERPLMKDFEGDNVSFEVNEEITSKLRKLSRETNSTMHMVLLSAFNILLSKYSNQEDIVIGIPIAGRPHADLQNIIGMFVNTLALRNKPEGNKEYLNFLREVKDNSLKTYENQGYQLESLVDKLNLERDTSRNPLFDVMFNMMDTAPNENIELNDITLKRYSSNNKISKFDFTLNALEKDNRLELSIDYSTKLFKKETIERLLEHYIQVLNIISKDRNIKLSNIDILSEKEKNQILYKFNDTDIEYPIDKTIYQLFEDQAEKTPYNIAVKFEDKEITYKELNDKTNKLARTLRKKGVKEKDILGVMIDRSIEVIVGILAVLKAGATYLPISTSYPLDRVSYILNDSKSKGLLISGELKDELDFDGEIINVIDSKNYDLCGDNLECNNSLEDLAYIIYTSGSTGKPKGVMISHKAVNNTILDIINKFNINENDKIISLASICFDLSVFDIFGALSTGATLVQIHDQRDVEEVIDVISKEKITIWNSVPAVMAMLVDSLPEGYLNKCLRLVMLSGDWIPLKLPEKIKGHFSNAEVVSLGGATEASIWSIYYKIKQIKTEWNSIPYGSPLGNQKLYILNNYKQLCPYGVKGEIYIGGVGIAKGYMNDEEKTKNSFINHNEYGMLYRTGDYGVLRKEGYIEFLGRKDSQIKIRGYRIEIGEIEECLNKIPMIKNAIVLAKEDKTGGKYLVGYIETDKSNKDVLDLDDDSLKRDNIRKILKNNLPDYMIPSTFVEVEKMPLTTNGKIDRKALLALEDNINLVSEYEEPRNENEEKLASIWREVLSVDKIGINNNFFELGGNSLKATILMSKIHKELNKKVPLKEFFKYQTIKELGMYIENLDEYIYSKIEKVEVKEYYETSSAQKRMYMLQNFDKDSTAYNMPVVLKLEGKINKDKIEETFNELIRRHEVLTTYFETLDGEIVQRLQKEYKFKLISKKVEGNKDEVITKFIRPFDLEKAPLFRAEIIESEGNTYLLIDMHHIISDGISTSILIEEFSKLYNGDILEDLRIQYKDFAAWQNKFLKSEEMKKQEKFWLDNFSDDIPVLNLPTDYERPIIQSFEGNNVSFEVNEEITLKLKELTRETKTTMHMVLLSVFTILLSKYSNQEDIVIGTPIAGRPHDELSKVMGMFVNTLALRNKPEGNKKYLDFLREVKDNSLRAYENQGYQLETLIEKLNIERDTSRNPLFDVMFNMIDTVSNEEFKLKDITLKACKNESKVSKFDITLNVIEDKDKLKITIDYCSKLFKEETIDEMAKRYVRILNSITNNVEVTISNIDMISNEEKNKILYKFNDTKVEYPKDKTIQQLFEEQVKRIPDNIAVVYEDNSITYDMLNKKANKLARVLREKGVKADTIVGIIADKSIEMIVGILAILKSGGAYLPIDSRYPKERIDYILKDGSSSILISERKFDNKVEGFRGEILYLEDIDQYEVDETNLININSSKDLCYVIYTSGTTGNPKGVMVEHKNVARLVKNTNYIKFNEDDRILQTGSLSFDASTFEIWGALLNGLRLYLADTYEIMNSSSLDQLIKNNKISTLWLTSALFNQLVQESPNIFIGLKYLLVGGDALLPSNINKVRSICKNTTVINGYGPTENTTFSVCYQIDKEYHKNIPIGKPISNSTAYIVDKYENLQPVGIAGELWVGGDGISRGYLNREDLTKEKFINSPFRENEIIYKTGDLARWLPDGKIEFMGRIDNQVKIRGFRIELDEIENRILQNTDVNETVVTVRENNNDKYICAYVVSKKDIKNLDLRGYLKEKLPEYMIPSYFVQISSIPLTANGKHDIKALPEPELVSNLNEYEAPRNELEEALAKIWSEVLGVEKIGINDSFFDLGGHSLKATVLMSKIHKELNKKVPLKEFFKSPTIKELSKYIESIDEEVCLKIQKVESKDYYETSSAQKRMYVLQNLTKDSTAYNMPIVFKIEGKVDEGKIEEAFAKLVERHEILRTYFETLDGDIVQRLQKDYKFELVRKKEEGNIEDIINKFVRTFDLVNGSLFRVELIENEEDMYLLIDMHHIISDGVSASILVEEFSKLYTGCILEDLKLQYKDFAAWQNKFLKSEEMKKQEKFWLDNFSDEIPVLNLPIDYERPLIQSFEGDIINFEVSKEITLKLKKLAKETKTTMHMVLLSAFAILLSKYSNQEDIIIGTPIAGRPHDDLQKMVGLFVNTLALRNKPEGNKEYLSFLKEVKDNSLKAYENQTYQFEALVDKLNLGRDTSRNPLFDVMFNMIDTVSYKELKLGDAKLQVYNNENKISKFDLKLNALEKDERLELSMEYCTKIFKKETVERFISHYITILDKISENNNIRLCEIEMLSEKEKSKILNEFNNTNMSFPDNSTVAELFEKQVESNPNNIAVIFNEKQLTYKELNEKANKLARTLRDIGIKEDSIVGIMVERSLEMVIGIMAILKAGGAYLPIDPHYPKERVDYIINDSNLKVMLTESKFYDSIDFAEKVLNLEDDNIYSTNRTNLEIINTPDSLAYIIYTSGSTGNPKGVMIEQKSLINRLHWMQRMYPLTSEDTILQKTTYTFDVSVWELIWWSLVGAKVCMLNPGMEKEPRNMADAIEKYNITVMHFVPSMLSIFINEIKTYDIAYKLKSLRRIFVSGEALNINNVTNFNKYIRSSCDVELVNLYGPTEASIDVSYFNTSTEKYKKSIPIGKPIDNIHLYVLDKYNKLLPIGVPGELYIAGVGVARGYLNKDNLTKERFIPNIFNPKERMYKSGDLVRWLPDGNIEYLGRLDEQVKIRGFRIELEEIEYALLKHKSIRDAVVIPKKDKYGLNNLFAYIVLTEKIDLSDLRKFLSDRLPAYMVPAFFVQLDSIPLTLNGKANKKELAKLDCSIMVEDKIVEPRNAIEKELADILCEELEISQIGIDANFFEIGGNSLKAIALISRINSTFNVNLPLSEFYKLPTIEAIAKFILKSENDKALVGNDGLVLIKKGNKGAKNLFFVHAISGEVQAYMNLCNHMNDNYNYWGLRIVRERPYEYSTITLEAMAKEYIKRIKEVQHEGPYHILGWCLGGIVSFEMVRQLELNNEEVKLFCMFNSPAPSGKLMRLRNLNEYYNNTLLKKLIEIFKYDDNLRLNNKMTKKEIWAYILEYCNKNNNPQEFKEKVHENICNEYGIFAKVFKSFESFDMEDIVYYFSLFISFNQGYKNYYAKNNIKSKAHYFVATRSEEKNKKLWKKYCPNLDGYTRIEADHFSLFEEDTESLAKELQDYLDTNILQE